MCDPVKEKKLNEIQNRCRSSSLGSTYIGTVRVRVRVRLYANDGPEYFQWVVRFEYVLVCMQCGQHCSIDSFLHEFEIEIEIECFNKYDYRVPGALGHFTATTCEGESRKKMRSSINCIMVFDRSSRPKK
eukprot:jgi/Psemu1/302240/fgenesh1_kg.63_\